MFRHILTLQQVCRRQISRSVHRQLLNKVPEKQKLFQAANGMPVHLKGGVSDAVLYRATMGLTVMGTACVIFQLVKAAVPQKKD
ncbi:cytochrome c oxidase subunit 7A2, mitochondrial [Pimephales promelas]|uniref:cytochrome c oxidase subunit 7A2, mitochondrial n=1 Tax=Pimephales promelas TaxID=90988 RepID=UPI001955B7F6|nr:cytochrome c oxidase subunit 7A2, mitochondrial [Pimephales promelas]